MSFSINKNRFSIHFSIDAWNKMLQNFLVNDMRSVTNCSFINILLLYILSAYCFIQNSLLYFIPFPLLMMKIEELLLWQFIVNLYVLYDRTWESNKHARITEKETNVQIHILFIVFIFLSIPWFNLSYMRTWYVRSVLQPSETSIHFFDYRWMHQKLLYDQITQSVFRNR